MKSPHDNDSHTWEKEAIKPSNYGISVLFKIAWISMIIAILNLAILWFDEKAITLVVVSTALWAMVGTCAFGFATVCVHIRELAKKEHQKRDITD